MERKKIGRKRWESLRGESFVNKFIYVKEKWIVCISRMSGKPTSQVMVMTTMTSSWSRSDITVFFQPDRYSLNVFFISDETLTKE